MGQGDRSLDTLDIIVIVYYGISFFLGLVLTGVGAWFHASKDVNAYITILVRSPQDTSLASAAALILVMGIVLLLISALALVGVLRRNTQMIVAHLWLQTIVIVFGLVAGFMTTALYWDTHKNVKDAMREQLNQYYDWDSKIGRAWNRVQVKKRCCGVDGSWDYENTNWFNSQNPLDTKVTTYVPKSCCALIFNQDQWLYWVNPQELQVKDERRCQEDAGGRIGNSANLNRIGCYSALFQLNRKNFMHDVTIFSIMNVIQGLGLAVGFLQLLGIAFDLVYIPHRRRLTGNL